MRIGEALLRSDGLAGPSSPARTRTRSIPLAILVRPVQRWSWALRQFAWNGACYHRRHGEQTPNEKLLRETVSPLQAGDGSPVRAEIRRVFATRSRTEYANYSRLLSRDI